MKLNVKLLKALLGLRSASQEEFILVCWMFLHAFCIGLFVSFYFSTANSVFINDWGSSSLPYGYVGSGMLGILIVNIYSRLQSRYSAQWLYKAVFTFIALLMVSFGIFHLMSWLPSNVLSAGLFILTAPLLTLCALETAGLSMLLFDLRQSKRFFALFSSGEILASIIGYLTIPLLIGQVGSAYNFLFFASAGALLALIVLGSILYKYKKQLKQPAIKKSSKKEPKKSIYKDRYVALIAITVGLSYVAIYFADFGFLGALKTTYPDSDEFIKSISIFFAIVKFGEFLLSLLSGKILNKLGMRFGLIILPILMFICTGLAFASDWIEGFTEISVVYLVFIFLAANKFVDRVVRKSIEIPATRILYMPLPASDRSYIQTKIDGNVQQIGTVAAGVSLVIFSFIFETEGGGIDVKWFTLAILPLLLIWILTSASLFSGYRSKLASMLKNPITRDVDSTRSGVDVLIEYIAKSSNFYKTLWPLLEVMNLTPLITPLDTSKSPIKVTDENGSANDDTDFLKIIKNQSEADKASLIYQAVSLKIPSAKSYIIDLLNSPAYAHLIANSIPAYGNEIVNDLEYVFNRSSQLNIKRKIIGIYRKINTPKSREILFELMDHNEPEVQHMALESLSKLEYTVRENQRAFVRKKISEYAENATWIYASLLDIRESQDMELLIEWLLGQLNRISKDILTLIGLIYGSGKTNIIRENLINTDMPDMKVFSLEMLDNLVDQSLKETFLPLFEEGSWSRKVRKMNKNFPQVRMPLDKRLGQLIAVNYATTGLLPKAEAIQVLHFEDSKTAKRSVAAALFSKNPLIYQTAALALYQQNDYDHFEDRIHQLPDQTKEELLSLSRTKNIENELTYTKVKLLRSFEVIKEANHDYLTDLAGHIKLVKLNKDDRISTNKGDKHQKLIWVIEGKLLAINDSGNSQTMENGDVFWGDLSGVEPVDYFLASTDTLLFSIDKRRYFDLMLDDEKLTRHFLDQLNHSTDKT